MKVVEELLYIFVAFFEVWLPYYRFCRGFCQVLDDLIIDGLIVTLSRVKGGVLPALSFCERGAQKYHTMPYDIGSMCFDSSLYDLLNSLFHSLFLSHSDGKTEVRFEHSRKRVHNIDDDGDSCVIGQIFWSLLGI